VIDAVLFDWGNTLTLTEWSDELARAGNEVGLAAVGRDGLPSADAIGGWWREFLSSWHVRDSSDELDTEVETAACFAALGSPLTEGELDRYIAASQRRWLSGCAVHPQTHSLLDELRARGLTIGVVSNSTTPTQFLDEALENQGLAGRVDGRVFSREIGKRKPHPAIFEAAFAVLGVRPERALFVGDRAYEDVRGARDVGMATVQALWFGAVDDPRGAEPDFRADEPLDVLDIVTSLGRRAA
jgi:putative hydrolase of the HAD superfamily